MIHWNRDISLSLIYRLLSIILRSLWSRLEDEASSRSGSIELSPDAPSVIASSRGCKVTVALISSKLGTSEAVPASSSMNTVAASRTVISASDKSKVVGTPSPMSTNSSYEASNQHHVEKPPLSRRGKKSRRERAQ